MPDIVIPKMGMTMSEATLVEWLRPDGSPVEAGDPVLVLSTDKLDTEVEVEASGTLRHAVEPGTTLPVGGVLGWVLVDGESAPERPGAAGDPAAAAAAAHAAPMLPPAASNGVARSGRLVASPNARRLAREHGVELAGVQGSGPHGRIVGRDVLAATTAPVAPGWQHADEMKATPTARRLARTLGIDLAEVSASAPGEAVTRQDVERAVAARLAAGSTPAPPAAGPAPVAPVGARSGDRIPLTGMRGVIARRMHESLRTMAQLTITTTVAVPRLVGLRDELKAAWPVDGRAVPTVTDFVVRAAALSLRRHPRLNACVADDAVELLDDVHIGLAVAVDDGLLVPVVRHADRLALADLSATTRDLAARARNGALGLDDLEGATFSVTSLGAFGVEAFTPVVNPPNVAILGVGRIVDGVEWVGEDRSIPRRVPQMTLSLTFDHRAVDGVPAAELLREVAGYLEAAHRLL